MVNEPVMVFVPFVQEGVWKIMRSPAERIPSHGTDVYGQRYAFDLCPADEEGRIHSGTVAGMIFLSTPVEKFSGWNVPVRSFTQGRVVAAQDGVPDGRSVNVLLDRLRRTRLRRTFNGDLRVLLGNFVIVEGSNGSFLYAHLRCSSIAVRAGDAVIEGSLLGAVGNSGNSTMPHLHLQMMTGNDPVNAAGLFAGFSYYDRWSAGEWEGVRSGVPKRRTLIRRTHLPKQ